MGQLSFAGGQTESVYSAELNNLAYASKNAVLSGCEVTESGPAAMTVDIAVGEVFFSTTPVTVSATPDLAIGANATGFTRIDLVAVNPAGVVSIIAGSAAAIPVTPDYDPEVFVILARVTVVDGATSIVDANIKDIRIVNVAGIGGGAGVGKFIKTFTSETTVVVSHNLGDVNPVVNVYDNANLKIVPVTVTVTDLNTVTVTFSPAESGFIIIHAGVGFDSLPSPGTQGNILYDNGTSWVALGVGTSGYLLQTNGAAANPTWVAPPTADPPFEILHDEEHVVGGTGDVTITLSDTTKKRLKIFIRFASGTNLFPRFEFNGVTAYVCRFSEINGTTSGGGSTTFSMGESNRSLAAGGSAVVDIWVQDDVIHGSMQGTMINNGIMWSGGRSNSGTHTAITSMIWQAFASTTAWIKVLGYTD